MHCVIGCVRKVRRPMYVTQNESTHKMVTAGKRLTASIVCVGVCVCVWGGDI